MGRLTKVNKMQLKLIKTDISNHYKGLKAIETSIHEISPKEADKLNKILMKLEGYQNS